MVISQGLGGPKLQPKGVSDGQQVNIPAPPPFFKEMTQSKRLGKLLDSDLSLTEPQMLDCQEKFLRVKRAGSVPQTDTGGLA